MHLGTVLAHVARPARATEARSGAPTATDSTMYRTARGVRREGWNAGSGVRVGVEVVDCSPQVGRAQLKSTITTQPAAHQCPWRPMGPRSSQSTFAKALDPSQRMCLRIDTSISTQKLPSKLYTDPYTPVPSAQRRTMACMCPPVTALGRVGRLGAAGKRGPSS